MKLDLNTPTPSASIFGRLAWWAGRTEDAILVIALLVMALIPVVELVGRTWFSIGIPGSTEYVQHLTLWIGFLGAMLASREDKHLKIAAAVIWLPVRVSRVVDCAGAFHIGRCLCWLVWRKPGIGRGRSARIASLDSSGHT